MVPTDKELLEHAEALQRDGDRQIRIAEDLAERLEHHKHDNKEADHLFRLLIEGVEDYAIFLLDLQGHIATWNAGAARFKGYQAHEIIGRHFSVFYPDEDVRAGKCERELEGATRTGRFEDEGWRIRKDGSRFWANVVITALRDASGTLLGFGKVTRDLTERKRAEEERRAADARFRLLVDSVRDYAIFLLDPDGNVASWNVGAERIKGYCASEVIGTHFSRFYPEEDMRAGKCDAELAAAARTGHYEDEGWRVRKDGTKFWANVIISAIRDDLGKLVGFSKVTRDLTERRRSERDRAARAAAEQANKTKDDFLAMLGHELRNPLAPIVSALQLLKLRGDARSVHEHQIIERQVRHMIRLVDDLLDVSRVSRGKVELHRELTDVRGALAKAVEIALPMFEARSQTFEIDVAPEPLPMHADDARLVQVFANLLNNSSKYTPEGGEIRMVVKPTGDQLVVEVSDTGIGITAALLPRVFELFVQGSQDVARPEGGLGVGLSLVRSLVEMHGGTVEARSPGPNKGATFTVRLPMTWHAPAPPTDPQLELVPVTKPSDGHRIAIVDDNEDARVLLAEILIGLGHVVETAADGPSGLALVERFAPQYAILDIGLPGMDGYELARRIRRLPEGNKIRLIALSGYGRTHDTEQRGPVEFDAHLIKPVEVHRVLEQLALPPR